MKRSDKFKSKVYRDAYAAEQVKRGLSYQIRALRGREGWSKADLAKKLGKPASVVTRIEDPGYGKFTIHTLLEVASAFDVALSVRFVPFSEITERAPDVSVAALQVPSFEQQANSVALVPSQTVTFSGIRVPGAIARTTSVKNWALVTAGDQGGTFEIVAETGRRKSYQRHTKTIGGVPAL